MILPILVVAVLGFAGAAWAHSEGEHAKPGQRPVSSEEHAFGREGDARKVARTVKIEMSDKMRFTPASLTVKQGETVKFVVKNNGKLMHEMVIGSIKELEEHAEMMKQHPGMEHDESFMAHVAPGKTESMVWQFTKPGEFHFGCLVPGHLEGGMLGQIRVLAKGDGK